MEIYLIEKLWIEEFKCEDENMTTYGYKPYAYATTLIGAHTFAKSGGHIPKRKHQDFLKDMPVYKVTEVKYLKDL